MKRKLLIVAAVCLALLACFAFSFTASAEETEPSVSIEKFNLAFEDNTYIKYAVKFTGIEDAKITTDNIGMLYWKDTDDGFVPGTEDFSSATTGYTEISGEKYYVFKYTNMVAKQLADYVYSVAYLEYDGETYYSAPVKFSALEYCYSKLGKTGVASTNADFRNLLTATLEQGAAAQKYFKYNTDRLANAEYYQINLVGGTFEDGFTSGLFLTTDEVKITAPETSGDLIFAGWKNSAGEITLENNVDTLKNITKNETYTATYKEAVKYSAGLTYTLNEDGASYSVTGLGTCTDTEIIIPSTYEGKPVTAIGEMAFLGADMDDLNAGTITLIHNITSITIPNTVTTIEMYAFAYCINLTEINIPNSVTTISDSAYTFCLSLTNISIPVSVTSMGDGAFSYCASLTSISIPDSVTRIGDYAFTSCTSLTSVTIGNSVTGIGEWAFSGCISLMSVSIPDSVKSIGRLAFHNCTSLKSITIPNSVTNIGDAVFYDCTSFSDVYYAGTAEEWANVNIGSDNSDLANATIYYYSENAPTTLGNFWHYVDGVVTVWSVHEHSYSALTTAPTCTENGYTTYTCACGDSYVGNEVVAGHTEVIDPAVAATCTETGLTEGKHCSVCSEVLVAQTVVDALGHNYVNTTCTTCGTIKSSEGLKFASNGDGTCSVSGIGTCTDTDIVIPSTSPQGLTVTRIDDYAFAGRTSLTSITIPDSVTSIGEWAFANCTSLENVYYTGDIAGWCNVKFEYSYSTPMYYADNLYIGGELITNVTIPDSVTSIGYAFAYCTSLKSITIPDSVTSIGWDAFYNCTSLDSVTIPDSVTSIADYAFRNCTSLTSITIPDSVTSIGDWAFSNCTSLTSVTIGNSVTSIGDYAFCGCSALTSVTIGDSVTSIGERAFSNCTSLTSITIPDSVMSIGDSAFLDCTSLRIYCEAASKPSGWSSTWNRKDDYYNTVSVVWGYTGE